MSNVKTFRSPGADPGQLPNLGRRAKENLEYIRSTIESGIKFTAVPGYGGILMGLTAIATAYLASAAADFYYWLIYWIFAAALAITIGILAMWRKAARCGQPLLTLSARKFALGFAPAIIAACMLTALLAHYSNRALLAISWVSLYGAAVAAGGAFSVKPVQVMGWSFIIAGLAAGLLFLLKTAINGDLIMALCFGVLHIVFGAVIARNYGG